MPPNDEDHYNNFKMMPPPMARPQSDWSSNRSNNNSFNMMLPPPPRPSTVAPPPPPPPTRGVVFPEFPRPRTTGVVKTEFQSRSWSSRWSPPPPPPPPTNHHNGISHSNSTTTTLNSSLMRMNQVGSGHSSSSSKNKSNKRFHDDTTTNNSTTTRSIQFSNGTTPEQHNDNNNKRQRVAVKMEPGVEIKTEDEHSNEIDLCNLEEEEEVVLEPEETHIIFVVDFSSSMKKRDVQTARGKKISRWDAVFRSTEELVKQQVEEQGNNNNSKAGGGALVSFVIFNDDAETLLEKMPLLGNGEKVRKALKTAHKMHTPKGGTGFSAGLQRAKQIAKGGKGNCIVVFLSDGRPGDLQPNPPKNADTPMQTTFRRKKKEYPAIGVHIEQMRLEFKDRFNLQLICLASEGRKWLEYLGKRYNGTFHMCDLTMDDDINRPHPPVGSNAEGEDNDDDDVVEFKVKSQDTLIAERYARAKATGNVVSIAATTQNRSTSIRATFASISSTVTAMRQGATGRRPLQERRIVLEKNGTRSQMVNFTATRMVLKPKGDGVKNAPGEKSDGRIVSISKQPFAQGGLRNVFRMTEAVQSLRMVNKVGKESRHEVPYAQRLQFHLETSRCQAQAWKYANNFNRKVKGKQLIPVDNIEVLHAEVYRIKDSTYPGGYRYLGVEEELKGKYEKWNSNNGFVLDSNSPQNLVAQAFSHFSYESSNQEEMVVDIQGSGFTYTDPQLHSKKKEYGRADRGESGFKDFFKTHKCNHICRGLGLQKRASNS